MTKTLEDLLSSNNSELNRIAAALFQACTRGAELAVSMKQSSLTRLGKVGRDFATEADIATQKEIVTSLKSSDAAAISLIGEEDDAHEITESEFIVIDPIDGTFFYEIGSDCWGVTAAYISDGKPAIGVIIQPEKQQTIVAVRGKGCWFSRNAKDFEKISLSHDRPLKESIIGMCQGMWNTPVQLRKLNIPLTESSLCTLMPGSAVDAASEMLRGTIAGYINLCGKIWDFAAFAVAVEEAGGVVSQSNGEPQRWDRIPMPTVFSANSRFHREVISITDQFSEDSTSS